MITNKFFPAVVALVVFGMNVLPLANGQGRAPTRRVPARPAVVEDAPDEAFEIAPPVQSQVRRASVSSGPRSAHNYLNKHQSNVAVSPRVRSSQSNFLGTTTEYTNSQMPHDGVVMEAQPEAVIGESYFDEGYHQGESCGPGGCGGSCGPGGCGGCGQCWHCLHLPICLPIIRLQNLELFAGVHGFTGPANRGGTGSFGFHEGLNWGGGFPFLNSAVSMQAGGMATQSNFNGTNFTLDERQQVFLTGGLFRRVDHGIQGGVVFDYMHDNWYYNVDLTQIRGELSWVFDCEQELGFWFTAGFDEQIVNTQFRTQQVPNGRVLRETFEVNDIYAAFYRRQFCDGGEGRLWGGVTGKGDGVVGAEFRMPLMTCVDLQSEFTYLIPREGVNNNGLNEETWNLSMNLVWYPGCQRRCGNPYNQPLFNVANNGSFLVDRR